MTTYPRADRYEIFIIGDKLGNRSSPRRSSNHSWWLGITRLVAAGPGIDYKTATTDQRKAVRQEARRCLPNETEAPIIVTGNLRAWRHIVEQRDSVPADSEICRAIGAAFRALSEHEPLLWEDYTTEQKRADGLPTVSTPFRKV